MKFIDRLRDWMRGYSNADIRSAIEKIEQHWTLPAGSIIPMNGNEMRALIGERLMETFWRVRDLHFVNHPSKRRDAAKESDT